MGNSSDIKKKEKVAELFSYSYETVNKKIRRGMPLVDIYDALESDDMTRREKKDYLYSLDLTLTKSVGGEILDSDETETAKDGIWERFNGDFGFKYNDSKYMGKEIIF